MASPMAPDNHSPSASSLFLPLGHRASRTSLSADRENLTEVLDQIHNAAYQSDSLTVFNEFSNLPSSPELGESKGGSNDATAGLSGFYNRFRASVGGVREIVGGSGRPAFTPTSATLKSPSTDRLSVGGDADAQISQSASVSGSKINSPVLGTWPTSPESQSQGIALKGPKQPPSITAISSKVPTVPASLVKSPVASIPKTANPTVSEVTVSAVKEEHPGIGPHILASPIVQSSESQSQESIDPSPLPSLSQAPYNHRAYSPTLTAKSAHNTYRDGSDGSEIRQRQHSRGETSEHDWVNQPSSTISDKHISLESDVLLPPGSSKRIRNESANELNQAPSQKSSFTAPSNSLSDAETPMTASGNSSLTRTSVDDSTYAGARSSMTSTTTGIQTSMSGTDFSTPASSRPSLEKPRNNLTPMVSQNRLPGFMVSRASSNDGTATQGSVTTNVSRQSIYRTSRPLRLNTNAENRAFSQLRSKLLGREFWMRDENAKDCFLCQEPFTTFRRKHHCRTCGQIFDSKCTVLIPGTWFGQTSSIRVCRPCEAMISEHNDDSSDLSDIDQSPIVVNNRHLEMSYNQARSQTDDDDSISVKSQTLDQVLKTPTMAIPATRRTADGDNRSSAVLEIESDRPLTRPTSSRSLRSSMNGRTHSIGHKRHHSRQQYIRSFKSYHEDRAPFQRRPLEDSTQGTRLPAFHRDSIIDPDLAQYLSDEASSADEQPSLLSVVSDGSVAKPGTEHERLGFAGFLAAVKKGRSRIGDRSVTSLAQLNRELDDGSVTSSKAVNLPIKARRRNLSVASNVQQRPISRANKDSPLVVHENSSIRMSLSPAFTSDKTTKPTRSSSMRGASAPAIELNRASLEHVRKLLRQLLKDQKVSNAHSWEAALLPILLKATDDVDPDVQGGDDMDIRHYVKLKKIPGGRPGDTSYVSGLVFTKNLALKSMPRSISQPRILIITFALEYARRQQHFMSLEPVIRQEREFLENLVSRIAAFHPHLLLVEKNISGLALELLDKAKIATAYNVKPSVLEAVSRCTQTRIIGSMDKLVTTPQYTGQCRNFDLKTYVYNGRKKTYMYISGCAKELGCTIVLRGGENETLIKIKRITEFMVYVVYNLKLETSLFRDEFAQAPISTDSSLQLENSTGSSSNASKWTLNSEDTFDSVDSFRSEISPNVQSRPQDRTIPSPTDADGQDDVPMPTYYEEMVHENENKLLSSSPFVKFEPPYLLMRARALERRLAYIKRLRDRVQFNGQPDDEKNKSEKFMLITPDMVRKSPQGASSKLKEVLHAVQDAEYDRALYTYQTQKRQWEAYLSGNSNLFDPYAHQNIVVLYSLVCTPTSIPCSGPDIFALDFYNEHESDNPIFESDCTLGQYVEDLCLEANTTCTANGCDRNMYEHHRQYVHGEAQISIFAQPYPSKLRGLQDCILMWSCCKICGNETQVIPMSESTWRYSFGKYLELSFWSQKIRARAGVCPHDIHRDHLRYFGFKDMALRIHYDRVTLLDIIVPRSRVTWKVDNDLKLRNEIYEKSDHRITKFMASVKARLKSINAESVMPEKIEDCKKEIEILMKKANEDQSRLIKQLQEKYMNSHYWEIIPLNEALRSVQEQVVTWDTIFADFESNFFPSEKDIRRLAALQLKKIFLDKDASATSITSADETATSQGDSGTDETNELLDKTHSLRRMTLSPEKAKDVLVSVVEEHSGRLGKDGQPENPDEVYRVEPQVKEALDAKQPEYDVANPSETQYLDRAVSPVPMAVPNTLSDGKTASNAKNRSTETLADQGDSIDMCVDLGNQPPPKGTENSDALDRKNDGESVIFSNPIRSGIPRPTDGRGRRSDQERISPPLRTNSQPVRSPREKIPGGLPPGLKGGLRASNGKASETLTNTGFETRLKIPEKISDRFGISALKNAKPSPGQSFIPRSVPTLNTKRVSSLAKHFEQLSREFDKERQRERQQRAAKSKHSRAYPMASSKPIVQIYKNVREAVEEREPSGESEDPVPAQTTHSLDSSEQTDDTAKTKATTGEKSLEETGTKSGYCPVEEEKSPTAVPEAEEAHSDEERSLDNLIETPEELAKLSSEEVLELKELPKHERSTLVKMLTNFWAERSASGWQPLDYPLRVSDHVFSDCDIIVREDEPSSLIAFALSSEDYQIKLASIQEKYEGLDTVLAGAESDAANRTESRVEHALLRATGTHLKYQFQEGQAKMLCKVFYAEQFDALRRKCGVAERIVESLSRCAKWDSKGGKTKSLFLKTLDDRFVLKSLSTIETQAFLKFAPAYFQIMSEALFHELPSVIAKMFGFYQVIIKNPVTGVEFNWFLLVMENLFYDRVPTRIFDLKGSMRNRKVQSTGERNEVLLDENMVDFIYESPLFTREHSKKLLSQSVWNDTLFLGRQNVMDYSLMVAIDENRHELVVGIIDCIRTYTWDKKLESWIKDRGFAGGGKNRPTVTSPKEYKSRFREAMARYVLQAPNCWHQFGPSYMDQTRRIENHLSHMSPPADRDNEVNE